MVELLLVPRFAPAATFVGFALAAAVLQVLATIVLGLARVGALEIAAAEGSGYYLLGALGTGLGMLTMWLLRRRALVALAVFVVWQGALVVALAPRTSTLGLAFHGEYVLHHFATFLSAAACVAIGLEWLRLGDLGKLRFVAGTPAVVGALGLLGVHLLDQPGVGGRASEHVSDAMTAVVLLAPVGALAVLWTRAEPSRLRGVAVALMVPLFLRIALAFPESLSGGSVPDGWQFVVMASIVAASAFTYWAFRPSMPPPVRIIVMALAGLATALMYIIYRRGFGQLEDGIGGLAQSLFGFTLPYPNYVSDWKIVVVTFALFFIFSTVYGGLMSTHARGRGLALAMLAVTGIGLSNPQLALMVAAGHLLWLHTLVEGSDAPAAVPPGTPVEDVLRQTADLLALPDPVVLETAKGAVVSVRGDFDGLPIEIRARPGRTGAWSLTLKAGMLGRGRPDVELVPDPTEAGQRPTHAIGRTHRTLGSPRALELVGDPALDALEPFPDVRARFFAAGSEFDFGRDLSELQAKSLDRLVRALADGSVA